MPHISHDSVATIYIELVWTSSHATHTDAYFAVDVNFTRETLPLGLKSRLKGLGPGDSVEMQMDPSDIPAREYGKTFYLPHSRLKLTAADGLAIKPRIGRFYPRHIIKETPGSRLDSTAPFRIVAIDKGGFKADINSPLAGHAILVRATVISVGGDAAAKEGQRPLMDRLFRGPGMQARLEETPTDFLGYTPFLRDDEGDDDLFFPGKDSTALLDSRARDNIRASYGRSAENPRRVLDLWAGRDSCLPESWTGTVTGIGPDQSGMEENTALASRVAHSLNDDPELPFGDASFDAVVCTSAIQYVTKPFELFEEVGRVLAPGGVFVVAFSEHWFEEKVIRIWPELHQFERMGLVSQYFVRTEAFDAIATRSERGWPTDAEDGKTGSDAVYVVRGRKKG